MNQQPDSSCLKAGRHYLRDKINIITHDGLAHKKIK